MRRLVLVLVLGGCTPAPLRLPDAAEIGTIGVLTGDTPRTLHLAPFDPDAPALPVLESDADGRLYALYFPASYTMPSGTFVEATDEVWRRVLPPPQQVLERGWSDGAWTTRAPEALPSFEFEVESPAACAERGGCYVDEYARACTIPCPPSPEPEPPVAPERPRYQPCPFGWTDVPELDACRGPVTSCPRGQRWSTTTSDCRAPGPPPPTNGDEWPAGLDEVRTRFVRAGASGGDGSRAQPWGTLEQALAAAPAGVTLALARGTYEVPPLLGGVSRLVGLAATKTALVSTTTVTMTDGLTLAALALEAPLVRTRGVARLDGVLLAGALVIDSGELTVFDVLAEGRVRVRAGGRVVVRDTALTAPLLALDVDGGASALVEESSLRGGLFARGAVTVRDSVLRSAGHPALIVERAEVVLSGVDLDTEGLQLAVSLRAAGSLSGQRVLIGPGQNGFDVEPSARLTLEDSTFAGGSRLASARAIHGFDADLTLRRVRVEAPYPSTIELDGAASQLTLEDYTTTSSRAGGLDIIAGLPIVIRRATLHGFNVFKMLNPRGMSLPWSLDVEDLTLQQGAIRLRGANNARFARLRAEASRGVALVSEATPDPPAIDLTDVHISGSTMPTECGLRDNCSGAGIQAAGPLRLERYRMEGNAGPAVTVIEPPERTLVRWGVVGHQKAAIALDGAHERLWALTVGLRLQEVPFACDPCGR